MTITVPKIGSGTRIDDMKRPDTDVKGWQKIAETEAEFVIEILEEQVGEGE